MKPEPRTIIRLADLASVLVILSLGAYGIFVLPYSFPLKVPVFDTPSYAVGFNNGIAVLVVVGVIGLLFLRNVFWRPLPPESVGSIFRTDFPADGKRHQRMPYSILIFFICAYVVMTSFVYFFIHRVDEYSEGVHWILRLKLALGYHLHPYRDFELAYGPLMHYLPAFVVAILSEFFGMSYNFAYLISLLISWIAGLWSLFYVVDNFCIRVSQKVLVFSIIALAVYDWSFNLAGTELRFAAPFAIAILMHKALNRVAAEEGRKPLAMLCGISVASSLTVFAISLEFGFLFLIAHAAYCLHRCLFEKRSWVLPLLATLACYPIWLVIFPGSLDRVSGGARCFSSLPIVPAGYILLYLLSLFWLVPILLRTCLSLKPGENAPFMVLWAVMLVGVVPASLGRCEHHHCLKSGLGTFILTFPVLATFRPRIFTIYAASFALVFVVIWRVVDIVDFGINLMPVRLALGGALEPPPPRNDNLIRALGLQDYPQNSIAIPLGVDRETRDYLIDTKRLVPQFYMSYGSVATQVELDRKISDLKKAAFILVPRGVLNLRNASDAQVLEARLKQQPQVDQQQSIWLGTCFLFPMKFKTKYLPFDPTLEEARYIAAHYEVVREAGDYVLMKVRQG